MHGRERSEAPGAEQAEPEPAAALESSGTRYTSNGAVPPVALGGEPQRPSASELAFKDTGMHLTSGLSKLEGGTMFAGAGASLAKSAPPQAKPPQADSRDAKDDDFEQSSGVEAAIGSDGMKRVQGVDGVTFVAQGVLGSGSVRFTFDSAYTGTFTSPMARTPQHGAYVNISVALQDCGKFDNVRLVQVCREFTQQQGAIASAKPAEAWRQARAGYGGNEAKEKSLGWRIDQNEGNGNPHWNADAEPGQAEAAPTLQGHDGSSTRAAKLRDAPGSFESTRNIGKEFRTCAVAEVAGASVVLACVDWGYYVGADGTPSFYPAKPVAYAGAKPEVYDAAERWNGMRDNKRLDLHNPEGGRRDIQEEYVPRRERDG